MVRIRYSVVHHVDFDGSIWQAVLMYNLGIVI